MRWIIVAVVTVAAFTVGFLTAPRTQNKSTVAPPVLIPPLNREVGKPNTTQEDAAQPAPEGFVVEPSAHDFGKAIEGEWRAFAFTIKRPDSAAFKLGRVTSTCPCVSFQVPQRDILAKEEAALIVEIHSLTLEGKKYFPINVEILSPKPGVLKTEVTIDVTRVPAKMQVIPASLSLGTLRESKTGSVRLFNLTKAPVRIKSLNCSLTGVTVTAKEGMQVEGGRYVTIEISSPEKSGLTAGPVRGFVTVETDCSEHARMEISVEGTVVGR